jgi:hypothetical protein
MTSRRSFVRKIIYISLIAVLLIPLYLLSHPATSAARGVQGNPGGVLARMRSHYHLSEAQLGEIDPGSVTIRLATVGMRGVAANILWEKATDYKMKKDWTNFGATLNQITKVQPNFINVWTNQAWNLSYNISVEFDDYRERYRWVIKGFNFLDEGIKYNKDQPRLQWEMGRMVSQKIGKADEVKQYRRLFADDTDYRDSLPLDIRDTCLDYRGRPDNWLVGKGWYTQSVEMVDNLKTSMMGQSPLIYRSSAPMCQMNYAEAVEKDGIFGEVAQKAWADASAEWHRYGSEDIPSSFKREDSDEPIILHLNDEEAEGEIAREKAAELDKMQPGLREKMIAEKKAALPAAQRLALDTPPAQRTAEQNRLVLEAEDAIRVGHDEVARRVSGGPERRDAAKKLAKEAEDHEMLAMYTNRYRSTVNFNYWNQHAKTEQGRDLLTARGLIYLGDRAYADGDQVDATSAYTKGLKAWRKVLDDHREYLTDQTTNEDLIDMIRRYRHVLAQDNRTLPEPFILQDVIDVHQKEFGGTWNKDGEKPKKDKTPAAKQPGVKKGGAKAAVEKKGK